MGNLTVLKTLSVPRTTTSKISCAVPRNTLCPAAAISTGSCMLVYSSILDSTPRISSGPIKFSTNLIPPKVENYLLVAVTADDTPRK